MGNLKFTVKMEETSVLGFVSMLVAVGIKSIPSLPVRPTYFGAQGVDDRQHDGHDE